MAALVYIFMRTILPLQHCLNDAYQHGVKHFMRHSHSNLVLAGTISFYAKRP